MRKLSDLVSVGPATVKDLELLGVRTVEELAKQKSQAHWTKKRKAHGKKK